MNIIENTNNEPYDEYLIKWKNYRSNELKNKDILQIVDFILSYESDYNKEYSDKWKNNRYVKLKTMKLDDLFELQLNYEILKLTPQNIKNLMLAYEQKEQLQHKITDNSKVKIVEYMFDGDELKFWDHKDKDCEIIDEIDLNDFIDWNEVNEKAINQMKELFSKETKFINIDEDSEDDDEN